MLYVNMGHLGNEVTNNLADNPWNVIIINLIAAFRPGRNKFIA